ncbi:MAG: hypothetical protein IGS48_12875 [Oscillatoriales cyanobacterium C42_A2020_001]|nr:hypothetical protein [Leptolyngbyaceae cyanobacterium C42_A2020_001]
MEPLLISENLVSFFKFWLDEQVHDGMRWGHELFHQYESFDKSQRQQAYSFAWALAERGVQVVITASQSNYRVWGSLRSHHAGDPEASHDLTTANSNDTIR